MGAHIPRRIYVRRPSLAVARWQLQGQGRFRFESGLHIVKVKQSICFSRTSIVFYNSYSISLSLTVRFLKVCLFSLPSVFLCLSLSFHVSHSTSRFIPFSSFLPLPFPFLLHSLPLLFFNSFCKTLLLEI